MGSCLPISFAVPAHYYTLCDDHLYYTLMIKRFLSAKNGFQICSTRKILSKLLKGLISGRRSKVLDKELNLMRRLFSFLQFLLCKTGYTRSSSVYFEPSSWDGSQQSKVEKPLKAACLVQKQIIITYIYCRVGQRECIVV